MIGFAIFIVSVYAGIMMAASSERKERNIGLFIMLCGFVVFVVSIIIPANDQQREERIQCEAKGGVYFVGRSNSVCLTKGTVIK